MTNGSLIIPRDKLAVVEDDMLLLALFVRLIERARFREGRAPDGSILMPGQLATGRKALALLTRQDESWCARALRRLAKRSLIELKVNKRGTIVTICDWPSYSRLPKRSEQQSNHNRTDSEQQSNRRRTTTDPLRKQKAESMNPSPSPPPANGWEEEVEVLLNLGVRQAKPAVQAAIAAGCTIDDWRPHREFWQEHSDLWDSPGGVLHSRLLSLRPGQAFDKGWLQPSESRWKARKVRIEGFNYDRKKQAKQKWDSYDRAKHLEILQEAGFSQAKAEQLYDWNPAEAERRAIAIMAPPRKLPW